MNPYTDGSSGAEKFLLPSEVVVWCITDTYHYVIIAYSIEHSSILYRFVV